MALTTDEQAAVTRLGEYNDSTYHASTNPKGLAGEGYKSNIPAGLNDMGEVTAAVAREAAAAVTSATNAASSEGNAQTFEGNASNSATAAQTARIAAETARDLAQAAAGAVTALDNLNATTNPTADHDSADTAGISTQFSKGSIWINTISSEVFRCIDATPMAAVWIQTTLTVDELGGMATQEANAVSVTGGEISGVKRRGFGRYGYLVPGTLTNGTVPIRFYAETNMRIFAMKFQTDAGTVDITQKQNGTNNIGFDDPVSNTLSITTTLTEYAVNEGGNNYIDLDQGEFIEIDLSNVSSANNLLVLMDVEDNR